MCREPISSESVLTRINEAYELVKQAGRGVRGRSRGGKEEHEYEVVPAHIPAQPAPAGEVLLQGQVSAAEETFFP